MAYTLAEFAKLDLNLLRAYDKKKFREDWYGSLLLSEPPKGELFLPYTQDKKCSFCVNGWRTYLDPNGWMGATCHFCLGTGRVHG